MDVYCGYCFERTAISWNSSPGSYSLVWQLQCSSEQRGQGRIVWSNGISTETGGRGGKGAGHGLATRKTCTQRKQHTGWSGPGLESISMLWEQWEKIQSMNCGSSSRLGLEAAVPRGHGKQRWAERNWCGTTDISYCPSAGRSPGLITSCKVSFNLSSRPWILCFSYHPVTNPSASLLCFRWRWNSFKLHVGWRLSALWLFTLFLPALCALNLC